MSLLFHSNAKELKWNLFFFEKKKILTHKWVHRYIEYTAYCVFVTFDEDPDDEMKHLECCQTGFFILQIVQHEV